MGLDFDIINYSNELIDRFSLGWLGRNYDVNFCHQYSNSNINEIIEFCDNQISMLNIKKNKLLLILNCWNENDFIKRKEMILRLLSNINKPKEFYETVFYFSDYTCCFDDDENFELATNSKLIEDIDYCNCYISSFESFKNFLNNYIGFKFEISY
jgi:hypothetical protein